MLVHVDGNELGEQAGCDGRRGGCLDLDNLNLAALYRRQYLQQMLHIHDIAQHVAIRLGDDGEVFEAARRSQKVLGLHTLQPKRRTLADT